MLGRELKGSEERSVVQALLVVAVSRVESISRTSTYERRARITIDADRRQDQIIESVMRDGFFPDWNAILSDARDVEKIGLALESQVRSELADTVDALAINGAGIAIYAQRSHDVIAGLKAHESFTFAEPAVFTPDRAVAYWQRTLNLTDAQTAELLRLVTNARNAAARIAARVTAAMLDRLTTLYERTVTEGLPLPDFIRQAREVMPEASRALLETEYRTHLTTVYSHSLVDQIQARANVFPFMQMMVIRDGRATWWICLPMGTAGPGGTGYICATNDPLVIKWRAPNHWGCRSSWSPLSYREAQRYGILAADGRTKIALIGSNPDRPYGDPPAFAPHPKTGELREVEPQEGFAG